MGNQYDELKKQLKNEIEQLSKDPQISKLFEDDGYEIEDDISPEDWSNGCKKFANDNAEVLKSIIYNK